MNIPNISNSSYLKQINNLSSTSEVSGTMPPPSPMGMIGGLGGVDSMDKSRPGEFFNKLEALKESDPEKFKEIVTQIADKLETAAKDEDLSSASSMLTDLATRFRDVANGGDISQIKPPEPPANPGMQPADEQYALQDQEARTNMTFNLDTQSTVQSKLQELFTSIFSSLDNI
jgi:hypothetical protein